MKKFLFLVSAGIALLFVSCTDKKETAGGMSEKAKKNLDATHIVTKAFETGDISGIDSAVASDFVDHTDKGDMGRDSLKAMITQMHATQNDMKAQTIKELADDEYVFLWQRYTGTSDGSMGMPKGPYDMTSIETIKFRDGKAIEHWAFMEPREMMKMMGNQQKTPPMDNKSDTAKKTDAKM